MSYKAHLNTEPAMKNTSCLGLADCTLSCLEIW